MDALDTLSRDDIVYLVSVMRLRRDDVALRLVGGSATAAHEYDVALRVTDACQQYLDSH